MGAAMPLLLSLPLSPPRAASPSAASTRRQCRLGRAASFVSNVIGRSSSFFFFGLLCNALKRLAEDVDLSEQEAAQEEEEEAQEAEEAAQEEEAAEEEKAAEVEEEAQAEATTKQQKQKYLKILQEQRQRRY